MCVRASLASMGEASPRVVDYGWGIVEVEGLGRFRDVKLWPGGGRAWDCLLYSVCASAAHTGLGGC